MRWAFIVLLLLCPFAVAEDLYLTGDDVGLDTITLPMSVSMKDSSGDIYNLTLRNQDGDLVLQIVDETTLLVPAIKEYPPTSLEGRVVDEKGTPIGGVPVRAEWHDSAGNRFQAETVTISREQAIQIGDRTLQGKYVFNQGEITAEPDVPIRIVAGDYVQTVRSLPGGVRVAKDSTLPLDGGQIVLSVDGNDFSEILAKHWRGILLAILGVMMILGVVYVIGNNVSHDSSISVRAKRLKESKVFSIMDSHPLTVPNSLSVKNVAGKFLTEGLSYAVVVEAGKPVGLITDRDIILKISNEEDIGTIMVGKIMSDVSSVSTDSTLETCISLCNQEKRRVITVLKKGMLQGTLTRVQLMTELDRFFSLNRAVSSRLLRVETMISEPVTVDETETVKNALEGMKERSVCNALITREREGKKELLGIVGVKEILDEMYNYGGNLSNVKVSAIMVKKVKTIPPGATLLEANRLMVETGFRLIPVTLGDELVGVITQSTILREMWNAFSDIEVIRKK